MILFQPFPRLSRFSHGWQISEKLDGSNSQLYITPGADYAADSVKEQITAIVGPMMIFTGSRNRLLRPGKTTDNHGFAQFVKDNAQDLIEALGEGRHFGEWVGKGVNKRHYNLDHKRFVLFNTARWTGADLPDRVDVVPVLFEGYADNPGTAALEAMEILQVDGSRYAPGFKDPEGVVMRHGPSGTLFKKTFDYDEQGKWAENRERKNAQA